MYYTFQVHCVVHIISFNLYNNFLKRYKCAIIPLLSMRKLRFEEANLPKVIQLVGGQAAS